MRLGSTGHASALGQLRHAATISMEVTREQILLSPSELLVLKKSAPLRNGRCVRYESELAIEGGDVIGQCQNCPCRSLWCARDHSPSRLQLIDGRQSCAVHRARADWWKAHAHLPCKKVFDLRPLNTNRLRQLAALRYYAVRKAKNVCGTLYSSQLLHLKKMAHPLPGQAVMVCERLLCRRHTQSPRLPHFRKQHGTYEMERSGKSTRRGE